MYNTNTDPLVVNCLFTNNTADGAGALFNHRSSPSVLNCVFMGNFAVIAAGAVECFDDSDPDVINCTFVDNVANSGGAIRVFDPSSTPTVTNCILWGNQNGQITNFGGVSVSYCDIEGGWVGSTNIDADPMFIDPFNGDLRLSPGSPCIDRANNAAVPVGITTDLDGNPRFVDDPDTPAVGQPLECLVVDMGAYEFQVGPTECCPGDCSGDNDGNVGIVDFLALLGQWSAPGPCDFDGDGVGITDFLLLLFLWGPCP